MFITESGKSCGRSKKRRIELLIRLSTNKEVILLANAKIDASNLELTEKVVAINRVSKTVKADVSSSLLLS
jgi:hypothetical protein